jgi:hypothetical protein
VMMPHRRGRQAGLPDLHPHQFRHTFVHQWLAEGGAEVDLMRLAGGDPAPWCSATAPVPPTLAPAKRTAVCHRVTGCNSSLEARDPRTAGQAGGLTARGCAPFSGGPPEQGHAGHG